MAQFGVYVSGGSGEQPHSAGPLGAPCQCKGCGGTVGVYVTRIVGSTRVRYLACKTCGVTAGKQLVPVEFSPRRTKE